MKREDLSFDEALKLAQSLGYAETTDPSADVDGHDACRKICILGSLAFGRHIFPAQVPTEGIRAITTADMAAAERLGYAIKLIGRAKRLEDGRVLAEVCPALLPGESQLASVSDVYNGILAVSYTHLDVYKRQVCVGHHFGDADGGPLRGKGQPVGGRRPFTGAVGGAAAHLLRDRRAGDREDGEERWIGEHCS